MDIVDDMVHRMDIPRPPVWSTGCLMIALKRGDSGCPTRTTPRVGSVDAWRGVPHNHRILEKGPGNVESKLVYPRAPTTSSEGG